MLNLTPADMASATHPQPWDAMAQKPIKMEPADEGNISKEQSSGFYSEGFHSASPSSSSKDSNGNSPRSVGSGNDPLTTANYYDTMTLKAKANLGVHLESYQNNIPYNLYVQHELQKKLFQDCDQPKYSSNSPRSLALPAQVSTPKACSNISPPSSPGPPSSLDGDQKQGFERFNDSGLEVNRTKANGDDGSGGDGSGLDDDYDNEPGLRTPVVNSHGKVKTFRCKQCNFSAVTKLTFWEHSKDHIKPEKMLTCRKCPFVTEYKHHLEYHMRNHLGSKPFRCPQCTYSCVNKSMLNSHLKSHSNVYQYRCANCNYATKYCHSLKLHLRKYKHNPAMVLNTDGTPNPLPIIDVYGTRRGPKQKSVPKVYEDQMMVNNKLQTPPNPHPIFGNHFPVNIPYLPPLIPHQFLFQPNNNYENRAMDENVKSIENQPNVIAQSILQNRLSCGENNSSTSPPIKSPENLPHVPTQLHPVSPPITDDALDLRNNKMDEACSPPPQERSTSVTPTASKNRRKGKAFKLQPAELKLQHENSKTEVNDFDGGSEAMAEPPTSSPVASYTCQFCNITFGDLTMHTIHMGFHGYNDPFMCNKCGERSADRVAFFIHLGRVQHA